MIYAQGFHISRGVMKKEVPVYEENAVDDDLLNEGKRNLLDYLQSRGHFDASVDIPEGNRLPNSARHLPHRSRAPAQARTHRNHRKQIFLHANAPPTPADSTRRQVFSPGRYSGALLKSDVADLQALYLSNGFRQAKIQTKVDDNYHRRRKPPRGSHSN